MDEALFALSQSGSSLVKLDLFNTPITDKTALSFAKQHINLRYISFSRCNALTSPGLRSCLRNLKAAEFLALRENVLHDEVLSALASMSMPFLMVVDISSCSHLTTEGVKQLAQALPHVLVNTSYERSKKYQISDGTEFLRTV